ncbi:MAG: TRAP transporter TatT component family protein [Candidatus Latescibacterota bacterium]
MRARRGCRLARVVLVCLLAGSGGCASRARLWAVGALIEDVEAATARQQDVALATQAAPAFLLMLEGLLESSPGDRRLLVAAARGYTAYGTLVAHSQPGRARVLYERGMRLGLRALQADRRIGRLLDQPYPRFARITERLHRDDVPAVFWTASSWGAWIGLSADDVAAVAQLPKVVLLMEWVLGQDETFEHGAPHLFLGVYHAALPPALGGRPDEARAHFERALQISQGRNLMARVLMARHYARQVQDRELFRSLLDKVLASPVDAVPELTLQNAAAQEHAHALLRETDETW